MISADMLRELGAQTRTFRTVKGAMLWYRDQLSRRLRTSRAVGEQHVAWSQRNHDEQNKVDATFAAVSQCVRAIHPADEIAPVPAEHFLWLVAWYETTWGDGEFLAKQANLSRWAFTRRCRKTENTLRRRMSAAGLLREDDT